jgi:hypothetical protein
MRQRKKDHEFEACIGHIARHCLKKKKLFVFLVEKGYAWQLVIPYVSWKIDFKSIILRKKGKLENKNTVIPSMYSFKQSHAVDYLWISMHLMKVQNSYSSCIRFQIMVAFSDRRLE